MQDEDQHEDAPPAEDQNEDAPSAQDQNEAAPAAKKQKVNAAAPTASQAPVRMPIGVATRPDITPRPSASAKLPKPASAKSPKPAPVKSPKPPSAKSRKRQSDASAGAGAGTLLLEFAKLVVERTVRFCRCSCCSSSVQQDENTGEDGKRRRSSGSERRRCSGGERSHWYASGSFSFASRLGQSCVSLSCQVSPKQLLRQPRRFCPVPNEEPQWLVSRRKRWTRTCRALILS